MRYLLSISVYLYAILLICVMPATADEQSTNAEKKQTENSYSAEQELLFATPHLDNIKTKAVLYYDFEQHGLQTLNFNDEIILTIIDISENGGKDVEVSFLSGKNNRAYADIRDFRSNPLIMFFLQWDVEKMDSGSKITHHYFRHLLRQAFLENADSEEIELDFEDREVVAHKVFFTPLSEQQGDERYKGLPQKYYEFIISDAVPGGIYSISTLIPNSEANKNGTSSVKAIESTAIRFNRVETSN